MFCIGYGEYLLDEKDFRRKSVMEAIAINSLDAGDPSKECMELFEKYIEGDLTMEAITKLIIEMHVKAYQEKGTDSHS